VNRRHARRAEPRIVDPATHPRSSVCLAVAAEFLGLDVRTVRARIENGSLPAYRDDKVYRIALADLLAYDRCRREAP
jgi:excisionase family DNA binding protein